MVTGAGNGLGLATIKHFLSLNSKVIAVDVDISNDELSTLRSKYPESQLKICEVDVTEEEQVRTVLTEAHRSHGQIDAVVNCAGIIVAGFLHSSKEHYILTEDIIEYTLKVNVLGTFFMSQAYAHLAITYGYKSGVIINISSIAGYDGGPSLVAYSASKGAIIGSTLPMARELGKYGIRVVTISPGFFYSKMGENMQPKYKKAIIRNSAIKRFGKTIEFAQLVEDVIKNKYLTGVNIKFTGGTGVPLL